MTKRELKRIFEEEDEAKELVLEVCDIVSHSDAEDVAETLIKGQSVTIDVFSNSYGTVRVYEPYKIRKARALLKIMYILDIRFSRNRSGVKHLAKERKAVAVLEDVIEYAVSCFDVFRFEKLIIFCVNTDGDCRAVYESSCCEADACYIGTEALHSILQENCEGSFIVFHSHPFGDPTPSEGDMHMHRYMKRLFALSGSDLIEHVVVATDDEGVKYTCLDNPAEYYKDMRLSQIIKNK